MELKELKKEVNLLPNIEKTVSLFEQTWLKPIKKNTNKNLPFLQDFNHQTKKELNNQIIEFKKILKEIKYGQLINEKLSSLAHYLVEIKVTAMTQDFRKTKRLLHKFIIDPHLNIKKLIFEVPYLESQLSLLKDFYEKILENISRKIELEQNIKLLEGKHKDHLQTLLTISQNQKKYLSLIGHHFISLIRNLKQKPEIKKFFEKNKIF